MSIWDDDSPEYRELMCEQDAIGRASEMMQKPGKDNPPLAFEFLKHLCNTLGGCGEVMFTAYAVYAQVIEGLPCSDDLYLARPEHTQWLQSRAIGSGDGMYGFRRSVGHADIVKCRRKGAGSC